MLLLWMLLLLLLLLSLQTTNKQTNGYYLFISWVCHYCNCCSSCFLVVVANGPKLLEEQQPMAKSKDGYGYGYGDASPDEDDGMGMVRNSQLKLSSAPRKLLKMP